MTETCSQLGKNVNNILFLINVNYIPTYAQISSVTLILKLLRHVSMLIHHIQEFTIFFKVCYPRCMLITVYEEWIK